MLTIVGGGARSARGRVRMVRGSRLPMLSSRLGQMRRGALALVLGLAGGCGCSRQTGVSGRRALRLCRCGADCIVSVRLDPEDGICLRSSCPPDGGHRYRRYGAGRASAGRSLWPRVSPKDVGRCLRRVPCEPIVRRDLRCSADKADPARRSNGTLSAVAAVLSIASHSATLESEMKRRFSAFKIPAYIPGHGGLMVRVSTDSSPLGAAAFFGFCCGRLVDGVGPGLWFCDFMSPVPLRNNKAACIVRYVR